MRIIVSDTPAEMGREAATDGANHIRNAITERGVAHVIFATGASQLPMIAAMIEEPDIDWSKVIGFHLDEYIGLPITHPASFRKYLKERLVDKVNMAEFHYVDGERDPEEVCRELGEKIKEHPIDVAMVGIGENGHLAFNDPPADFDTQEPYIVVELDEACRKQQLGEGWFPSLDDVPKRAISMSVQQILKSRAIVCTVPDARKAEAVRAAVEGKVTNEVPASILQRHANTALYLDTAAASLLENK